MLISVVNEANIHLQLQLGCLRLQQDDGGRHKPGRDCQTKINTKDSQDLEVHLYLNA